MEIKPGVKLLSEPSLPTTNWRFDIDLSVVSEIDYAAVVKRSENAISTRKSSERLSLLSVNETRAEEIINEEPNVMGLSKIQNPYEDALSKVIQKYENGLNSSGSDVDMYQSYSSEAENNNSEEISRKVTRRKTLSVEGYESDFVDDSLILERLERQDIQKITKTKCDGFFVSSGPLETVLRKENQKVASTSSKALKRNKLNMSQKVCSTVKTAKNNELTFPQKLARSRQYTSTNSTSLAEFENFEKTHNILVEAVSLNPKFDEIMNNLVYSVVRAFGNWMKIENGFRSGIRTASGSLTKLVESREKRKLLENLSQLWPKDLKIDRVTLNQICDTEEKKLEKSDSQVPDLLVSQDTPQVTSPNKTDASMLDVKYSSIEYSDFDDTAIAQEVVRDTVTIGEDGLNPQKVEFCKLKHGIEFNIQDFVIIDKETIE